ncbi:hypothetical protein FACS1894216_17430 [Synergistales bacterium]|nr:hypothetical protein FACS1894216_17430 [Synergistales bacterium]
MRAGKSVSLSILRMPPYDETLTTQNIAAAQVEAMQEIAGLKDVKTGIRNIGGMDWAVVSYATEFMGTHSSGVNYSFVKDGGVVTTLYFKFDNLSDYESVAEKTVESFKAK